METESALDCNQWKRLVYVSSKVQLLMSVWKPWTLHLTIWVAPHLSELSNMIKITKLEV